MMTVMIFYKMNVSYDVRAPLKIPKRVRSNFSQTYIINEDTVLFNI